MGLFSDMRCSELEQIVEAWLVGEHGIAPDDRRLVKYRLLHLPSYKEHVLSYGAYPKKLLKSSQDRCALRAKRLWEQRGGRNAIIAARERCDIPLVDEKAGYDICDLVETLESKTSWFGKLVKETCEELDLNPNWKEARAGVGVHQLLGERAQGAFFFSYSTWEIVIFRTTPRKDPYVLLGVEPGMDPRVIREIGATHSRFLQDDNLSLESSHEKEVKWHFRDLLDACRSNRGQKGVSYNKIIGHMTDTEGKDYQHDLYVRIPPWFDGSQLKDYWALFEIKEEVEKRLGRITVPRRRNVHLDTRAWIEAIKLGRDNELLCKDLLQILETKRKGSNGDYLCRAIDLDTLQETLQDHPTKTEVLRIVEQAEIDLANSNEPDTDKERMIDVLSWVRQEFEAVYQKVATIKNRYVAQRDYGDDESLLWDKHDGDLAVDYWDDINECDE